MKTEERGRGSLRWLVLLAVLVAGALALGQLFGGGGGGRPGVSGDRVASYLLDPRDLAAAEGAPETIFQRTNPPLDPAQVERTASSLTLGRVPLPDDRGVSTFRRADTGEEITQVVLLYDDPAAAEDLDELGAALVAGAFGLESQAIALPGAEGARSWTAEDYRAVSFRRGGAVVFVGTTGTGDVMQLATHILARIQAQPPPSATSPAGDP